MQRSVLLLLCLLLTWSVEVRSVSTSNTGDVGSGKVPSDDEDWGEGSASGSLMVSAVDEKYDDELILLANATKSPKHQSTSLPSSPFTKTTGEPATEEYYEGEPEVSTSESPIIVETATEKEKDGKIRMVDIDVDQEEDFEAHDNDKNDDPAADGGTGILLGSSVLSSTHFMAALIVGGCVGLLFAICVIMLLAYRMRKKDEGSYALDEQKKPVSSSSYKYSQGQEYYA